MVKPIPHILALLMALSLTPAAYADVTAGPLVIENARAAATHPHQLADAGYLTIRNTGDSPDRLIGISGDFAALSIHLSRVDANGVAHMDPVAALPIPAHGSVTLKPGGYHIMMMGLKAPLRPGQSVTATLRFEKAGPVPVRFTITAR